MIRTKQVVINKTAGARLKTVSKTITFNVEPNPSGLVHCWGSTERFFGRSIFSGCGFSSFETAVGDDPEKDRICSSCCGSALAWSVSMGQSSEPRSAARVIPVVKKMIRKKTATTLQAIFGRDFLSGTISLPIGQSGKTIGLGYLFGC